MSKLGKKSISTRYMQLWSRLSGWRLFVFYTLHYTALFAILWPILFLPFYKTGKMLLWTQDEMPYLFTRLVYLSKTIRTGIKNLLAGNGWTIPLYDFTSGISQINFEISPLSILAIFWPWDEIDALYDWAVIFGFYLVGLSFSFLGFYFKQKPLPVLIGAISYTFCGYSLHLGLFNPEWCLTPQFLLPLLIVGAEKVLRRERPFLFIAAIFISGVSSVYYSCMQAILVVIYVLIRFFSIYEKERSREFLRMIGRFALGGGIGVALCSVVVIPSFIQLMGSGRVGDKYYTSLLDYGKDYYVKYIANFSVTPSTTGYGETELGFSVLTIPSILMLFIGRKKENRSLRWLFVVLTAMVMLPIVAYLMSGFSTTKYNRWCYAYALCCAAILTFELPRFLEADKTQLFWVCVGVIAYLFVYYFVIDHGQYREDTAFLIAMGVVVLMLFCTAEKRIKTLTLSICLVLTCASVWRSAYVIYSPKQMNWVDEFCPKDYPYEYYYQPSQYSSFSQSKPGRTDKSFYRVGASSVSRQTINASFYWGINGLTTYASNSTIYPSYVDWTKELEREKYSVINLDYGPFSRTAMFTLAGVKYYLARDMGKWVLPYGFKEVDRVENGKYVDVILENQYTLPIGYTYDHYLPRDEYESLNALEKQEAQLQTIVLDKRPGSDEIEKTEPDLTATQVQATVLEEKGLHWGEGELSVSEANATLTLTFEGLPKAETYLRVVNLSTTSNWRLTASVGKVKARGTRFCPDSYNLSHGEKTQLINLGYSEDGYTTCTITFPNKGVFPLEDLQIWCQPMEHYGEQVDALREETLENVETNWRGLTGEISVSKDKMMCLAIPYDEGWTAYVDGVKTDIFQANTAFMAIELEAGEHTVEFRFVPTGMTFGFALTVAGVAALVWMLVYDRRKRGAVK